MLGSEHKAQRYPKSPKLFTGVQGIVLHKAITFTDKIVVKGEKL
jgi:hypothetical protein